MFDIFQRLRWAYLSVFGIQVAPVSAIIVWREWEVGGHSVAFDLLIASMLKIDDICYLSILTSVIIVDIGRYLVGILIKAPQDRAYEQGLAKGMREGVTEERQRWIDYDRHLQLWRNRLSDAQLRGEPFDEPMPRSPLESD